MDQKPRKRYTGAEIIGILRKHLVDGVAVSDVCTEAGINPTQFYRWRAQLFGGSGAVVFDRKSDRAESRAVDAANEKVAELEKRLQRKHEVLSEVMEELVSLKKTAGAN